MYQGMELQPELRPRPVEVPAEVADLARRLADLPLAAVSDLTGILGLGRSAVNRRLLRLQDLGLAEAVELSWYGRRMSRWWLTERCLAALDWPPGWSWHDEGGRCYLLHRLALVEGFYRLAAGKFGLGRFREFRWVPGRGVEAVVRYERGWAALLWHGLSVKPSALLQRLENMPRELAQMQVSDLAPVPSAYGIAVPDAWQREVSTRILSELGLARHALLWVGDQGLVHGESSLKPWAQGGGWISPGEYERFAGDWTWERRLKAVCASLELGTFGKVALDRAWQWPGMPAELAMGPTHKRYVWMVLKTLIDQGLLERLPGGKGGASRYGLTRQGVNDVRYRDSGAVYTKSGSLAGKETLARRERIQAHEEGLMGLMSQFNQAGLMTAEGSRSWETISGGKALSPDGVVWLEESPYGPGWHYVEYERQARSAPRVAAKLRGYAAASRRDDYPCLMAVATPGMESLFQEAGERSRLKMLTATFARLEKEGGVGRAGPWSLYGQRVAVG